MTAILLWSSAASVGKLIENFANSLAIALSLLLGGILFFGSWSFIQRETIQEDLSKIRKNQNLPQVILMLVAFGTAIGLYYSFFYYSIQNAPSIEANILNYLWPIFSVLLSSYVFQTNKHNMGVFGFSLLCLSFFGATLVAWDIHYQDLSELKLSSGHIVALSSAFLGALYLNFIFLIKKHIRSTPFIYFSGMLFFLPMGLSLIFTLDLPIILQQEGLLYLAYLTFLVFGGGQFLLIKSIELNGMMTINALAYLTPFFSSVWLHVFIGENITSSIIFGALLIVTSNILLNNTIIKSRRYKFLMIFYMIICTVIYTFPMHSD